MTDAKQIAAGLSEAQKRALRSARLVRTNPNLYALLAYRDMGKLAASIDAIGLTRRTSHNGTVLNVTGLAVRKELESQ